MSITRTDKLPPIDLLARSLANQLYGGRPGQDIEELEAEGQAELVAEGGRVLPTKGLDECPWVSERSTVEGDPLFSYVTLPAGWTVVPTEHSMWSNVLDDQGRVRAGSFYKAASYDRSAHISPTQPFAVLDDYIARDNGVCVCEVWDQRHPQRAVVFRLSETLVAEREARWEQKDRLREACVEWLRDQVDTTGMGAWDLEPLPPLVVGVVEP